ncbi:SRPBCC family protein [Streptomyces armeniacus]|nr:SRPBCC family protein [Streptomyces armeniacus]
MAPIVSEIEIDRPPEAVFAYATDPLRFAEWQNDVVEVRLAGGGPPGVGTRFTTVRRVGRGPSRVTFTLDFEGRGLGDLLTPVIRTMAAKRAPASYWRLKERPERGAGREE